jgi:hypothetical protein
LAHQPFGGPVVIKATATPLHTLLGLSDTTFGPLVIRAETTAKGQAGRIYVGTSTAVTAAGANAVGYLDPGEWLSLDQLGNTHTNALFLVGTLNDKAYVLGITY